MKMKKTIDVSIERNPLFLFSEIAYTTVSDWFGLTMRNLKLNVIRPQVLPEEPLPLIIWFCGGAWKMMNKDAHTLELGYFADRGYIVASVEYRTSNQVEYPGQLQDAKAAIRYLRAHAKLFGIDVNRIAVMGESAGAHLACITGLLGKDRTNDVGDFLEESSEVQAVVDWYGPCDLNKMRIGGKESVFNPEEILAGTSNRDSDKFKNISPIRFVTKDSPPFLILHGVEDDVIPISQGELLYDTLTEHGVPADLYRINGANHADIQFSQTEVKDIILNYLNKVL